MDRIDGNGMSSIQSLSRGLEILGQFDAENRMLTLSELSRKTGLHRATVYRFVKTLEAEGFVAATESGAYAVGPAWAMALYALGSDTAFAEILSTDLRALAESCLETVALGVRRGDNVQIVHIVPASLSFVPALPPNRLHPLHALWNSHSKMLLAHADEATRQRMLSVPQTRFTKHTLVEAEVIRATLQRVREEGVSYDREEFLMGTCAVCVPIVAKGKVTAALALVVPVERFTEEAIASFLFDLRAATRGMEERLEV